MPLVDPEQGPYPALQSHFLFAAALLTAFGLYVSSLATGGLRAMVIAVPIGFGILLPVSMVASRRFSGIRRASRGSCGWDFNPCGSDRNSSCQTELC